MKLLKLRNLIAAREFNTAAANRDLAQFGQWTVDFAQRDAELAEQIAAMLAEPEGNQRHPLMPPARYGLPGFPQTLPEDRP